MLFAVAEEAQFEEKLKKAGLDDSGEEVNVVIVDSNERHYPMVDEEFSEDTLDDFIQSYLNGEYMIRLLSVNQSTLDSNFREFSISSE